jgi:hypothetical protein
MKGDIAQYERAKTAAAPMTMWIFLSFFDYAGKYEASANSKNKRLFPFDCLGTDKKSTLDLFFKAYGKDV